MSDRRESFSLTLTTSDLSKAKDLAVFTPVKFCQGDMASVRYAFSINYLYGCAEQLEAILSLLETGRVVEANLSCVSHQKSLLLGLVEKLDIIKASCEIDD